MKERKYHHCSFCNEMESDTRTVLPGPGKNIGICGECIAFSQQILSDKPATELKDGECSFCGKMSHQVERLVCGPGVNICSRCIAFAQQQLDNESTQHHAPGGR